MVEGYIRFAEGRAGQAEALMEAIANVGRSLRAARKNGALTGPGPVFVGIGASLAATVPAVWSLRSRGVHAWRLSAGDYPLAFPASEHSVIGVSQSGRSAETLAVMHTVEARQRIAIVNVTPSPIADLAPIAIAIGNLRDSYASTIGYTATVAAACMLAEAWDGGTMDDAWELLPDEVRQVEFEIAARPAIAAPFRDVPSIDCVAAAASLGTAEEGALLLREVARIPAAAFSTRQYLHGLMESAGQTGHILFGDERETAIARTLARAGHETILVTGDAVAEESRLAVLRLPPAPAAHRAILEAVVMQALVAAAAALRGVDPDAFVFHSDDTKVA